MASRILQATTPLENIVDFNQIGRIQPKTPEAFAEMCMLAEKEPFEPASEDAKIGNRVAMINVDWQICFIEGLYASLGVKGSKEDLIRLLKFIHRHMGGITNLINTGDWHLAQSIFFSTWFLNNQYENPDPKKITVISEKEIREGKWFPRFKDPNIRATNPNGQPMTAKELAIEYCHELESSGRPPLTIWPYHALQGSVDASLEPQYFNLVMYHSISRGTSNQFAIKGFDISSDMYGALKPEFSRSNFLNKALIDTVLNYDWIITCGEARNFCWDTTLYQIVSYFMNDKDPDAYHPEVVKRIIALEDCTSPIGPMTPENLAVEQYCRDCGVQFRKSTDDFSDVFGQQL